MGPPPTKCGWKASIISYSIVTSYLVLPHPIMPVIPTYSVNTEGFIKGCMVFLPSCGSKFCTSDAWHQSFNTSLPFERDISPKNP